MSPTPFWGLHIGAAEARNRPTGHNGDGKEEERKGFLRRKLSQDEVCHGQRDFGGVFCSTLGGRTGSEARRKIKFASKRVRTRVAGPMSPDWSES